MTRHVKETYFAGLPMLVIWNDDTKPSWKAYDTGFNELKIYGVPGKGAVDIAVIESGSKSRREVAIDLDRAGMIALRDFLTIMIEEPEADEN